ncbi:hypothetical protein HHI36_012776 [Cryptolaemus montrouzieri]|uniref:Uncharacterized protein n=1 Tax=Cryptolaemus montrouzieri TaxID=559131 RepID=A0ABD2NF75_9CUCU
MDKLDEDFGCRELKDDDSIISERCWRENHRGDSRKWLTSDGQPKIPAHRIYSTMKATYRPPVEENFQFIGKLIRAATIRNQKSIGSSSSAIQCVEYDSRIAFLKSNCFVSDLN